MESMVSRYLARPNVKTAQALINYMTKHRMALLWAGNLERGVIKDAADLINVKFKVE